MVPAVTPEPLHPPPPGVGSDLAATLSSAVSEAEGAGDFASMSSALERGAVSGSSGAAGRGAARLLEGIGEVLRNVDSARCQPALRSRWRRRRAARSLRRRSPSGSLRRRARCRCRRRPFDFRPWRRPGRNDPGRGGGRDRRAGARSRGGPSTRPTEAPWIPPPPGCCWCSTPWPAWSPASRLPARPAGGGPAATRCAEIVVLLRRDLPPHPDDAGVEAGRRIWRPCWLQLGETSGPGRSSGDAWEVALRTPLARSRGRGSGGGRTTPGAAHRSRWRNFRVGVVPGGNDRPLLGTVG